MKKLLTLTSAAAFALILGFGGTASADPLALIGNNVNQVSRGNTEAGMDVNAINNSTLRNGAAGNTLSVSGGRVNVTGNQFRQLQVGGHNAYMEASAVNASTLENFSTGNAATVF
jgi:hypothetical protein